VCPSGFVNVFLSKFFQVFSGFFRVFFGFVSDFEFFRVFLGFGGFFVSFEFSFGFLSGYDFFGFRVHPRVKNKTRTQIRFCAGWIQVQVAGVEMHPSPHPSGAKPAGDQKPELELSSLLVCAT
jgi:hypothetical protein